MSPPCSDERAGDREHEQHMREGAALLCAILRNEMTEYSPSVRAWWEEHKRFDRHLEEHGSWGKP